MMSDENSLVNLGGLTKPITVLIEKVANAIGVLYEPSRITKIGKANAEVKKIEALVEIEVTEIQRRGLVRVVHESARKQKNIENILSNAIIDLPENAETENLDEDWLAHFFSKCENVSDLRMQSLWSKILADEATKTGMYSKKTLDIVASLNKSDAELFTKVGKFVWCFDESHFPFIFNTDDDPYKENEIKFSDLKHLNYLGLVSFEPSDGYIAFKMDKITVLKYFNRKLLINFQNSPKNEISTGKVIFTQAGEELFRICGAEFNSAFYLYSVQKLFNQNLCISSPLENTPPW